LSKIHQINIHSGITLTGVIAMPRRPPARQLADFDPTLVKCKWPLQGAWLDEVSQTVPVEEILAILKKHCPNPYGTRRGMAPMTEEACREIEAISGLVFDRGALTRWRQQHGHPPSSTPSSESVSITVEVQERLVWFGIDREKLIQMLEAA
jgi:hypothetical protein